MSLTCSHCLSDHSVQSVSFEWKAKAMAALTACTYANMHGETIDFFQIIAMRICRVHFDSRCVQKVHIVTDSRPRRKKEEEWEKARQNSGQCWFLLPRERLWKRQYSSRPAGSGLDAHGDDAALGKPQLCRKEMLVNALSYDAWQLRAHVLSEQESVHAGQLGHVRLPEAVADCPYVASCNVV